MMMRLRSFFTGKFATSESGVVMTEAILAVPIITLLSVGVLEFGAVLWEREQIDTGLRDAARYVGRCHATASGALSVGACEGYARNLAYTATIDGSGSLRVAGWTAGTSNIVFTYPVISTDPKLSVTIGATATTTHKMITSPLFGFLGIGDLTVTMAHTQPKLGW